MIISVSVPMDVNSDSISVASLSLSFNFSAIQATLLGLELVWGITSFLGKLS
jgi:hypothetical protein